MMRTRRVALLAALLLTACGPNPTQHVLIAQDATNINYGGSLPPTPTPAPPLQAPAIQPGAPPLIIGLPPLAPPVTITPACPTAGPLASPDLAATTSVNGPPVAGTYTYRVTGSETDTDGNGKVTKRTYPSQTTLTVANPQTNNPPATPPPVLPGTVPSASDTTYTFDLKDGSSTDPTTTSFQIDNGQSATVPQQGNTETTGMITITKLADSFNGSSENFTPSPGIELMQLPATGGATWQSESASSPTDNPTPEEWNTSGNIGTTPYTAGSDRVTVDACGQLIQGWNVYVTSTVTGSNYTMTITANYVIATQYGGLPVSYTITHKGIDQGITVDSTVTATIDQLPAELPAS